MSDLLRDLRALAQAEGLASRKAAPIIRAVEEIERLTAELADSVNAGVEAVAIMGRETAALRARVEQLEWAAHLAAADFEEARRVASLCLENIRSVVPDPRKALRGSASDSEVTK